MDRLNGDVMNWQKVADKILSGRFILTCICGMVFAYVACKGKIEVAAITAILSAVFTSYFGRNDRIPPANGGTVA